LCRVVHQNTAMVATHTAMQYGRSAGSRGAEAVLARACVVLTAWESAYRGGELAARLYRDPDVTVDALLAAVADHQVAELVDLTVRAHHAGLLTYLAPPPPRSPRCAAGSPG
jgi:hypothetical protein